MPNPNEKELKFHDEGIVSRVAMWANIMAFVILSFAMISFAYDAYSIIGNWRDIVATMPPSVFERIAIFVSRVFMTPVVGVFYFLVLRGLSQLLNLGMDLYYKGMVEEEEEETIEA